MSQLSALVNLKYDYTIIGDASKKIYAVPDLLTKADIYYDISTWNQLTEKYVINNNETPEQVAYQFYGDMQLHWTILYINKITDLGEQWPIPDVAIYPLVQNPDVIHHYEYKGLVMDYDWIVSNYNIDDAIPFTNLDVAVRDNDNRRLINVIRPTHIGLFVESFMSRLTA